MICRALCNRLWTVAIFAFLVSVAVAACGGGGSGALQSLSPPHSPPPTMSPPPPPPTSAVYYTTGNSPLRYGSWPALLGAIAYPITPSSTLAFTLTTTAGIGGPDFNGTQGMAVDAHGRLFVVDNYSQCIGIGHPSCYNISVFNLPLTPSSKEAFYLELANNVQPCYIAFDAAGNLWVRSAGDGRMLEYDGPFTVTKSIVANIGFQVSSGTQEPFAFDATGNLYVSWFNSTPFDDIEVFLKGSGFSNATVVDHYLRGVPYPEGLAFDKAGNLYAAFQFGVAKFNHDNLGSQARPNVVDGIGRYGYFPYEAVFDANGNLYVANCNSIYAFPTGTRPFSPTLAPIAYADAVTKTASCVFGIAIY